MARIVCPERAVDVDTSPATSWAPARTHPVARWLEVGADGLTGSTELIQLASGVAFEGANSVVLVVRLHRKSAWTTNAGSATTLSATVRAQSYSYSEDSPGRASPMSAGSRSARSRSSRARTAPFPSVTRGYPESDFLRVVLMLAQGATASDKLQTPRLCVDLIFRPR